MNNIESVKGEIVMYQPDETIRLEVRMGEETVWLTQQQMAELFDKDWTVISRHIRNIYKEEELDEEGTYAKFAYMGSEGVSVKDALEGSPRNSATTGLLINSCGSCSGAVSWCISSITSSFFGDCNRR